MALADHGANESFFVQGVAHHDTLGTLSKFGGEIGINAFLHQDTAACCASFAVVAEDHEDGGIQRTV
jgi:hypothetical protein